MRRKHCSLPVLGMDCHKIAVVEEVQVEGEIVVEVLWKHAEEPDGVAVESSPGACFRTDSAAFLRKGDSSKGS
jgi:hypothetical protein